MINFLNKIKLFTAGLTVMLFVVAVSVNSCNTKKAGSDGEGKQKTEHPAGDGQEHPASQEQPADSVKSESEHPTDGDEHPSN
jgi:predicted small secreted protein